MIPKASKWRPRPFAGSIQAKLANKPQVFLALKEVSLFRMLPRRVVGGTGCGLVDK